MILKLSNYSWVIGKYHILCHNNDYFRNVRKIFWRRSAKMSENYFDILEGKNVRKLICSSTKMSENASNISETIFKMSENYLAQVQKCLKMIPRKMSERFLELKCLVISVYLHHWISWHFSNNFPTFFVDTKRKI